MVSTYGPAYRTVTPTSDDALLATLPRYPSESALLTLP